MDREAGELMAVRLSSNYLKAVFLHFVGAKSRADKPPDDYVKHGVPFIFFRYTYPLLLLLLLLLLLYVLLVLYVLLLLVRVLYLV